jgi:hypothetical protein
MENDYDLKNNGYDESKTTDVKYRLGKLILLNFYDMGMLSKDEFLLLRDKLIEKYKPVIGELERGAPWVKNEYKE